ncbi:nucleoside-diphosphate-sugar epimerase [Antricoccus suffuscus]|uniref:Nucleoside-diphosphate-sugar epimerase n=1 Tax=Antricoccus suffuscus TaxID=1629062 RepID=A0A2T0ZXE2_9ACTN|nr:NAD-dependent epimerase/dehydratase family protein [Antricoccus suffuscus]PRZ41026.1 nucleoside-diphosphate-sugar epimerase [Antricoccus suffuscus]
MATQLVIGAGRIGSMLAKKLSARGDSVIVVTRSGTKVDGATARRADAGSAADLTRAADKAATIFLCTNPSYPRWAQDWPPVFSATIAAAEHSGARLVVMGNLYAYGVPDGAMRESDPLNGDEAKGIVRRNGWRQVMAAHDAGKIQAVEVRASDYFGAGAGVDAHLGVNFMEKLRASKTAYVVGDPDLPHSWTYLPDIVETLIAAADFEGEWGRAWHAPNAEPLTRTEIARRVNAAAGSHGKIVRMPQWMLRAAGAVAPRMREIYASSYQFTHPFVVDSTETENLLGVRATPWDEALAATLGLAAV